MDMFHSMRELLHSIEEYHDSHTKAHEDRVGKMMGILGRAMGLDNTFCLDLECGGSLHDIGKLAIPDKILEKPGKLSLFEREVVELHVEVGYKLIQKIKFPNSELVENIVLTHHECVDGSGYPNKLKKEEIPLEGRICCICDVYDALRFYRPYRGSLSHEKVIEIMQSTEANGLANKLDRQILEVFSNIKDQYVKFYEPASVNLKGDIDNLHTGITK